MILARTLKGQGVSFLAGQPNWHGKALKKGDELARALAELEAQLVDDGGQPAGDSPARDRADAGARRRRPRRRRPMRWAIWWPRARPTARPSPSSATSTRASSRSTPT